MAANFALHSLGWQAFQDLCVAVAEEALSRPVQTFLPTKDAGRDGAFVGRWDRGPNAGESTIQCKFTSKLDHNLSLSMLEDELPKAKALAARGLADDYIILTNHPVTGESELTIREAFEAVGVKRCRVFHRDWIVNRINASPRLRMMVPRIYGLADLQGILGEDLRAYKQAQLILSEMGDNLRKFVVTDAHRRSVTALNEHGVVLLLGEPAAGKSTIGASLALAAADRWKCAVVKATSPESLEPRIDPDAKQFFWIDDAFGSTQFQHDRIERWNQLFPLMQAALTNGSKFLITSRDYIWVPARKELKLSAFPSLRSSQVVIYTQQLSAAEKERILYNHIKLGDQPPDFKRQLKPLLRGLAARRDFLPETARRLGNRVFTRGLVVTADRVTSFFQHPRDFLEQTISTLAPGSRAAIGLLFLNGGLVRSPVSSELLTHPAEIFGATKPDTREQLTALDGSLLLLAQDDAGPYWTYRHPTVTDAFASFVGKDPELVEIYLRGAKPENLIREVVCAGVSIRGAMVTVPQSSADMLVERIASLPKDSLKNFISARANKDVAGRLLACRPDIYEVLDRPLNSPIKEDSDAEFVVALHKLGLLPEDRRRQFFERVLEAVTEEADPSFIDNDDIADVLTLKERAELIEVVRSDVLSNLALYVETQKDRWESNYDPEDYFEPLMAAFVTFADAVGEDPSQLSRKILPSVNDAIDDLKARYYERQSEQFDDGSRDFSPEPAGDLFRDVDE